LSVQDSNNKHIEDEYLDQREQVGKNEGQIYFISLPTEIFLFYRLTDPYFSHDLLVEQQIKFVSPYRIVFLKN